MRTDEALAVAKGAVTLVPGAYSLLGAARTTPEGQPPEYFYGVWLKHLTLLDEATGCGVPRSIVELGPGDSIGVGIAALLSGSRSYVGVDARPYAVGGDNDAVANRLVEMFAARTPVIPSGWPEFRHLLNERGFPSRLLTEERLACSLAPERVERIREAVRGVFAGRQSRAISYRAPLSDPSAVADNSADLLLSHSVLEHVDNLPETIRSTYRWLRPGGYASHQFDLRCHDIVRRWDGHRAFGSLRWGIVVGGRRLINRLPYSSVLHCFEDAGFRIIRADRLQREPELCRSELSKEWRDVSDDDLQTEGGYVIAQKS